MKKIVKVLPVALALLAMPAFADPEAVPIVADVKDKQTTEFTLTVGEFFNIQKQGTEKLSSTMTLENNYSSFTLTDALATGFRVYTNRNDQTVCLRATAGDISFTDAPALYGTKDAPKLIFANTSSSDGAVKATKSDIKGITGNTALIESPNVFALSLNPTLTAADVTPNGATGAATADSLTNGVLTYSMPNGIYDFLYTTSKSPVDGTFNTYDTRGVYTATLEMTNGLTP